MAILKWTNLSVINIKDFPETHKKISEYFFVTARHELGLDFDMEHRGISVNTQDPLVLQEVVRRLSLIEGIEITQIEKIPNKQSA